MARLTSSGPSLLGLVLATLISLSVTNARPSAVDLFGFGARGTAMGGAVATSSVGFESIYYNPASLTLATELSFNLGLQTAHFDLEFQGEAREVRDAPALTIGFGIPVPFGGPLKDRLFLGFGFVIPQSSVLIADIPRAGEPGFALLDTRAQAVAIQASIAYRLTDGVSLGVGLLALGELVGGVDVAPKADGTLGSTVKSELVAAYSFSGGLLLTPTDWFRAALVVRNASYARFLYPMDVNLGDGFPLPIPRLGIEGMAQYDPGSLAVELLVRVDPRWLVAAGLTFKAWSLFPNRVEYTAVPSDTPPQPEPLFNDTLVARVGVEGALDVGAVTLKPRAGFVYEPTPAPEARGFHAYLDNDRVISALGLGLTWGFWEFSVAGQWHHLLERSFLRQTEAGTAETWEHSGDVFFWLVETGVRL